MSLKNTVTSLLDLARSAAGDLVAAHKRLERDYEKVTQQRAALLDSMPQKQEVISNAHRLVDELAAARQARLGFDLVRSLAGRVVEGLGPAAAPYETRPPSWPESLIGFGPWPRPLALEDLAWLLRGELKSAIDRIIAETPYPSPPGPPMPERTAQLAALDQQLLDLEQQSLAMADEAAKVGVTIPVLNRARQKRAAEQYTEQARREREAPQGDPWYRH